METLLNLIIAATLYVTGVQVSNQQETVQQIEIITPQEKCCEINTQICIIKNEHFNNNLH